MVNLWKAAMVVVLAFAGAAACQDKEVPKALEGKWTITKMIKRGAEVKLDANRIDETRMTIANGRLTYGIERGGAPRTFRIKVDTAQKPAHIDLTAEGGDFKGQTMEGIYQLDGDTLILCLPHDRNKDRPDAFEAKGAGNPSRLLFYLKRDK